MVLRIKELVGFQNPTLNGQEVVFNVQFIGILNRATKTHIGNMELFNKCITPVETWSWNEMFLAVTRSKTVFPKVSAPAFVPTKRVVNAQH